MRVAEGMAHPALALPAPFYVATVGSAVIALAGWRALGRGFAAVGQAGG
jgi:hypothetical protein